MPKQDQKISHTSIICLLSMSCDIYVTIHFSCLNPVSLKFDKCTLSVCDNNKMPGL